MRGVVSKPPEPTKEQWIAVTMAIDPSRTNPDAGAAAYRAWDLIRDIVVEAAAARCEIHGGHGAFFGRLIRDLKGAP